ncbi:MAG: monofunctional biosynthetic peptidoglycan transglycosylase [Nitrospinota bacterium]
MTLLELLLLTNKTSKDQVLSVLYFHHHYQNVASLTVKEIKQALKDASIMGWRKINVSRILARNKDVVEGFKGADKKQRWKLNPKGEDYIGLRLGLTISVVKSVLDQSTGSFGALKKSFKFAFIKFIFFCVLTFLAITMIPTAAFKWIDPPTTSFIIQNAIKAPVKNRDCKHILYPWTDWKTISPHIAVAVIAAEDQRFPDHDGFDLDSIGKAMRERFEKGRVRGASTISRQLAKNLFLWSGRSWLRKALEVYFTTLIEAIWPKKRILEVYLNVVEFGPCTFGITSASKTFFKTHPSSLNKKQAALLASVLPNPKGLNVNNPSEYLLKRVAWVQKQVSRLGGTRYLHRI